MNCIQPSVDSLAFAIQECTFILSSMRKLNQSSATPFASMLINQLLKDSNDEFYPKLPNEKKIRQDDPFLSGFVELRSLLIEIDDLNDMDIITLIQPYLIVIKSRTTPCVIMDMVITSFGKLIKYGIIHKDQKNIIQALSQVVVSLCHCKFKGEDEIKDDILVIKIISLLEAIVNSDMGPSLTDDSIYEIMSTCFSLAINSRRKELLTDAAESSLLSLTSTVFSKLQYLESKPEIDHNFKSAQIQFSTDSLPTDTIGGSVTGADNPNDSSENLETVDDRKIIIETISEQESISSDDSDVSPFGVKCMSQFLGHTMDILSPENSVKFTESSKILALQIMLNIVEVAGCHLVNHPQLFSLIEDNCCHHLVNLIQNIESSSITTLALKLFLYFALNMPNYLKIQLEVIFNAIFDSLIANHDFLNSELKIKEDLVFQMSKRGNFSTPILNDEEIEKLKKDYYTGKSKYIKEIMIETISVLWYRSPYFFINLFKSYDCDFDRTDLANSLLKIMTRLSSTDASIFTSENAPPICLDSLLSFINGIYERVRTAKENNVHISDSAIHPLIQQHKKKFDFIECVQIWNDKPKDGLKAFQEKGFLKNSEDPVHVASFLFNNSGRMNKKKLGELLGKKTSTDLLNHFVNMLDFKNLRPDEALRMLLNYFRLPGEAQQIDRIVETFNRRYVECQENEEETEGDEEKVVPDSDSLYVLSFSIIMLNTDLHNPNIKKPMSLEDYQRNLRGCYKGKDFPTWYTQKMYNSIKDKEIVMPEEHKGDKKWFESIWTTLVAEQESKNNNKITKELFIFDNGETLETVLQFDKLLFEKNFRNIMSCFVMIFESATHDSIITKMMTTIEKCAAIAIYFECENVINDIVEITAHLSTLTGVRKSEYASENREMLPVVELKLGDDETVYTSDLSVLLGKDYRAQLSTLVLFRVLKRYNFKVTKAWIYVMKIILKLFQVGLFDPNIFIEFQQKLEFEQLRKPQPEFQISKEKESKDSGLFSTFSSYLKGFSDDTPEPTSYDIEQTLNAIDFIENTGLQKLLKQVSKSNDHENLNRMVQILFALLPKKNENNKGWYIEETLMILETCVCYLIVTKNNKLIQELINKFDEITDFEKNKDIKMSFVCRILSYQLLLLQGSRNNEKDKLSNTLDKLFSLSKKTKDSFVSHGKCVLIPLEQLALVSDSWCQKEIVNLPQYWNVLRTFASTPTLTKQIFNFVKTFVDNESLLLNIDNYMDILGLLDEISAVGAIGAQWEHECEKHIADGLKVDNISNPFQELVDTGMDSIKLTSELGDIFNSESFMKSMNENSTSPWYPLIEALSHQCYNPCRELRTFAQKILSSVLIGNSKLPLDSLSKDRILDGCFRLTFELLKPEIASTDLRGMLKTQRDVLLMVCKIVLAYDLDKIEKWVEKVFAMASQMLQNINQYYPNSSEEVEVEVMESLKNLLFLKKNEIELTKLKGYKMEGKLKGLIDEVLNEKSI
ncbi:Arf family guanine nucleotide exchange factor [Martiniozyma asiatica (nom. inval.)]|nr:Arf family guanine nucleotide exchange factor [Martiniozyma asiatica]